MGEGTQTPVKAPAKSSGKTGKYLMLLGGTAVAVVVAGVLVQVLRPAPAFPDAQATTAADQAGRASVGEQKQVRYLARVNGKMVTWDEVADECMSRYGQEVLDNIINRKIIQQACEAEGVEVTEAQVGEEVVRIAKKFGLGVDHWMQMLQAERNLTPAQYKRDVIWPMLALKQLAGDKVTISDDEIKKAFIRNYGERVKARAIVLDNPRRASEVWEKVRQNPEDFGRLARQHSVDPASRPLEGAIPPIRQHGGSPELEKAAFKLKEGEISGVIQISLNQYVILMCEGRTEQVVDKLDAEVEGILRQELIEEKVQASVAGMFEKIKDNSRVDNYLTGVATGGEKRPGRSESPVKQAGGAAPANKAGIIKRTGMQPGNGAAPSTRSAQPRPATAPKRSIPADQE